MDERFILKESRVFPPVGKANDVRIGQSITPKPKTFSNIIVNYDPVRRSVFIVYVYTINNYAPHIDCSVLRIRETSCSLRVGSIESPWRSFDLARLSRIFPINRNPNDHREASGTDLT